MVAFKTARQKTKLEFLSSLLQSPTFSITTDMFLLTVSSPPCPENRMRTGKLRSMSNRKERNAWVPATSCNFPPNPPTSGNWNSLNRAGNQTQTWMLQFGGSEKMEEEHPQQLFKSPQSSYKPWSRCSTPKFCSWDAASHHHHCMD